MGQASPVQDVEVGEARVAFAGERLLLLVATSEGVELRDGAVHFLGELARLGITSVQLFVQRALLNLEPIVRADAAALNFRKKMAALVEEERRRLAPKALQSA